MMRLGMAKMDCMAHVALKARVAAGSLPEECGVVLRRAEVGGQRWEGSAEWAEATGQLWRLTCRVAGGAAHGSNDPTVVAPSVARLHQQVWEVVADLEQLGHQLVDLHVRQTHCQQLVAKNLHLVDREGVKDAATARLPAGGGWLCLGQLP